MKRLAKDIIKGSTLIIGFEALAVGSLLYFLFPTHVSNSPIVACIIALSFATVGEAVLLPILAEFGIIGTRFGQLTLGIGTIDDIFEVATLASIPFLFAFMPELKGVQALPNPLVVIIGLLSILLVTLVLVNFRAHIKDILRKSAKFKFFMPLFILLIFFYFIAVGSFVEGLSAIAAIFAGIAARALLPEEKMLTEEKTINFLGYIFLSPLFFLSIGASVSLPSIVVYPLLLIAIWSAAKGSKLLASFLLFHRELGKKYSLLMGLGLSVRFSTSLIVQYIFLSSGLITMTLYSTFIASAILMKPVILGIYSWTLAKTKPP